MKVRLLTSISSLEGWSYSPGQVVDMPEDVARRLVDTGQAEALKAAVDELPVVDTRPADLEQATVEPPEQAVHLANRRRRGRG